MVAWERYCAMTDNVVRFRGITKLPIPASVVLDEAPRDMTEVIIIGRQADGEFYFASSEADGGNVLWWLEMAKRKLIDKAIEME